MTHPLDENPTPFGLLYQLEQELRPYTEDNVRIIPDGRTGVYALWLPNETGCGYECIYVGMSTTSLRRRLMEHLQRETNPILARDLRLYPDLVLFSFAYTQGRQETMELEDSAIKAWKPRTNRRQNPLAAQ